MNITKALIPALLLASLCACSCNRTSDGKTANSDTFTSATVLGNFNADSAYRYIADQVAFGPRVPNTEAHALCMDYLVGKLHSFGADTVIVDNGEGTVYTGEVLPIHNITASYNMDAPRRVLLAAHYDSRPFADWAHTPEARTQPVLGANDGGSGVAVLLEIARNLAIKKPNIGVDILLTDLEDYGDAGSFSFMNDTWCLGSQYWVKNMPRHIAENIPVYGILLDMVGGIDARFHYEAFSHENAAMPSAKIWSEAQRLGLGNRFVPEIGGTITDDHVVLTHAGIPTCDIIETNNHETSSFPPTWHTDMDDLEHIDKSTLADVGKTVLNIIYKEKAH
ncbi:MAG: M28 family peptidase [Bacteroidales bacterium]|nr:M28 family peptidase [Bacteroidales bacterium]